MNYLKNYTQYLTENIAFDQLGTDTKVTYTKKDGSNTTKEIHRIDHDKEVIYFLDKNGKEFSKTIDEIVSVEN